MKKLAPYLIIAVIAACASVVNAQTPAEIFSMPRVRRALDYLKATEAETINEQIRTCEIPAPTFK
jgi:hypothetical protein